MGCSGCGKRRPKKTPTNIMEEYKYLNDRQIKARLAIYKKQNCQKCENKEKCNYEMYVSCKKTKE